MKWDTHGTLEYNNLQKMTTKPLPFYITEKTAFQLIRIPLGLLNTSFTTKSALQVPLNLRA